jgi:nitrite reductase (NADH) small subunit
MSETGDTWIEVGRLDDVPSRGARTIATERGPLAVFRAADGHIFALWDRCPHKGGPLSQGIVHGHSVTCPLHNWVIDLATGEAQTPDKGCARKVEVKIEEDRILISASALRRRKAA